MQRLLWPMGTGTRHVSVCSIKPEEEREAGDCRLSHIRALTDGGWGVAHGSWRVTDSGWGVAYGSWRGTDGGWRLTDGGWTVADGGSAVAFDAP